MTNEQKMQAIINRIELLEGRNRENQKIVKKLRRQLNKLKKED